MNMNDVTDLLLARQVSQESYQDAREILRSARHEPGSIFARSWCWGRVVPDFYEDGSPALVLTANQSVQDFSLTEYAATDPSYIGFVAAWRTLAWSSA